jgi:hypothetical protein
VNISRTASTALAAVLAAAGIWATAASAGTGPASPGTAAAAAYPAAGSAAPACRPNNSTEACVARFYGAYLAAVSADPPRTELATKLRGQYLTAEANRALDEWARQHGADPVLRAQDVPLGFDTTYAGSSGGHSSILVTLHWSQRHTVLAVRVDLAAQRISGVTERR